MMDAAQISAAALIASDWVSETRLNRSITVSK